ncbi:neurogenic locus notch homolog protein 1-like [Saccostrea echinata]|uniref:neurogenic locus notch homolog protein 1-like n=1 Tax=Saccostrea echinata TaxID=191078 RepID=UPI002A8297AC|nr:neurogenic locus notch homolog protein 1-like [Saccostrea echinata]
MTKDSGLTHTSKPPVQKTPVKLSDNLPLETERCRGGMCRKFRSGPVESRTPDSDGSCPPSFHSVVTDGVSLCVHSSKMLKVNKRPNKLLNKNFHQELKISNRRLKTGKQKVKKGKMKKPINIPIQTNQHSVIFQKYTEKKEEQRCEDGEVLIQTLEGAVCRRECESGQTLIEQRGIRKCVDSPFKITVAVCPEGETPTQTTIGIVCEKSSNGNRQPGVPLCEPGERLVHLQTGPACIRAKSRRPNCSDGQKLVQLGKEFYCISPKAPAKPKCSVQEKEVHTIHGIECRPKPCPDSFIPIKTATGTICQSEVKSVPASQQETKRKCAPGQTLVTTEEGDECWFVSNSHTSDITCPPGQVLVRGTTCKDPVLISPDEVPCPPGQSLVMTTNGVQCQYRRKQNKKEYVHRTRCPEGEILTLDVDKFICRSLRHDIESIVCDPEQVVVQGQTGIIECVSEEQTNLICDFGLVLTRGVLGYACNHGGHASIPNQENECGPGEVIRVDGGSSRCVNVEDNVQLCGPGHEVVIGLSGEVVCKNLATESDDSVRPCSGDCTNLNCDEGLVPGPGQGCLDLKTVREMECVPECANGGSCEDGRCVCPPGLSGPVCHNDVDECATSSNTCQFSCRNTFGSFHCVCPSGFTTSSDRTTCIEEHCIPGCLNGGVCKNGKCQCPDGFSGTLCQEDINECTRYVNPCEDRCRNTYGSYFCSCPPGSQLREDKRTCQSTTCNPTCINGGRCHNNRCRCPPGFYGIICQLDLDECLSKPCKHCVNTIGSYHCIQ